MQELKVKCKDPKNVIYFLWGKPGDNTSSRTIHNNIIDFASNKCNGATFYDMRQFKFQYYRNDALNRHHVFLSDYIEIVYPYIANILNFPYNRNDFTLKEHKNNSIDCSFLWPKKDYRWTVSINQKIVAEHKDFECLTNINGEYPGCKNSIYHTLFSSSHESCKIVNESLKEGKTILLSGDSYLFPVVPILACYFKEVVSLDNRPCKVSNVPYYEGKEFDYVVISLSEMNHTKKFLETNFY